MTSFIHSYPSSPVKVSSSFLVFFQCLTTEIRGEIFIDFNRRLNGGQPEVGMPFGKYIRILIAVKPIFFARFTLDLQFSAGQLTLSGRHGRKERAVAALLIHSCTATDELYTTFCRTKEKIILMTADI